MIQPQVGDILHASCIALNGRGLLITGPSGSGKSALALRLLAYGAGLVSDDRTEVFMQGQQLMARAPAAISGLIEARGIGILRVDPVPQTLIVLVVDLARLEVDRLPQRRAVTVLNASIDLVLGQQSAHFAEGLCCYLRGQRFA